MGRCSLQRDGKAWWRPAELFVGSDPRRAARFFHRAKDESLSAKSSPPPAMIRKARSCKSCRLLSFYL